MRVFTVFCQKPLLRPIFQMDIHAQLHSLHMYIHVQCTVPSIHDCKDMHKLTKFFLFLNFGIRFKNV